MISRDVQIKKLNECLIPGAAYKMYNGLTALAVTCSVVYVPEDETAYRLVMDGDCDCSCDELKTVTTSMICEVPFSAPSKKETSRSFWKYAVIELKDGKEFVVLSAISRLSGGDVTYYIEAIELGDCCAKVVEFEAPFDDIVKMRPQIGVEIPDDHLKTRIGEEVVIIPKSKIKETSVTDPYFYALVDYDGVDIWVPVSSEF